MESNSDKNNIKPREQYVNSQSSSNDKKPIGSEKNIGAKSKFPKKVKKKITQKKEEKENNLESFSYEAISSNALISTHIHNLVKCFTSNSNAPPNELSKLEQDLYEKTVSMFSLILNSYEQKLIDSMLKMDCFRKVIENTEIKCKSVSCQTDISYGNTE